MRAVAVLEEMSEDEVLDFAGACADAAQRAEVDLLHAAHQWSVMHSADRLDPLEAAKPGRENARRLGGAGVPEVSEFAAAELGARIGRSPYAAARLIADAQDLHHRHPRLWERVQAGEVRASYARHVVARTRHLSVEQTADVDAGVVEAKIKKAADELRSIVLARGSRLMDLHGVGPVVAARVLADVGDVIRLDTDGRVPTN